MHKSVEQLYLHREYNCGKINSYVHIALFNNKRIQDLDFYET